MSRTASSDGTGPVFEGWNIGAVSVKRVQLHEGGVLVAEIRYVNIGAFNCAPANTASAVIHALSLRTDTPYAVIESDGDCITGGQSRQLETVAVQCRHRREVVDETPAY